MNTMSIVLKIVVIVAGGFLLTDAIFSLARRKMTESFCLMWGLISVFMIIGGSIIRPSQLSKFISPISFALILMIIFILVYIALFFSHAISDLMRKNNELAIQVSLLVHEKDEIQKKLSELTGTEPGKDDIRTESEK